MRSHAILEVWFLLNIGALHTADALFFLNSQPTTTSVNGYPAPVKTKSFTMPAHERIGLENH